MPRRVVRSTCSRVFQREFPSLLPTNHENIIRLTKILEHRYKHDTLVSNRGIYCCHGYVVFERWCSREYYSLISCHFFLCQLCHSYDHNKCDSLENQHSNEHSKITKKLNSRFALEQQVRRRTRSWWSATWW